MTYRGKTRRTRDPVTGKLFRSLGPVRRLGAPPVALRRSHVRLDNLALVPASLLPYKQQYQQLANELPEGDVLIILPSPGGPSRQIVAKVAALLQTRGHRVTTVSADGFR